MQTKTPRFHDAQRGCLFRLQSAHDLFVSSLTSALSFTLFASALVAAAGGGRRDMVAERVGGRSLLTAVSGNAQCGGVCPAVYVVNLPLSVEGRACNDLAYSSLTRKWVGEMSIQPVMCSNEITARSLTKLSRPDFGGADWAVADLVHVLPCPCFVF